MLVVDLVPSLAEGLAATVLHIGSRGMIGDPVGLNAPILAVVIATTIAGFFLAG